MAMKNKKAMQRKVSAVLSALMVIGSVNVQGLAVQAETKSQEEGLLAYLDFEQEPNALSAGNPDVAVYSKGENVLQADSFAEYAGKSLYLDGTGSNYLSLINQDGTGVLAGKEHVTISYWSKVTSEANRANWGFMIVDEQNAISSRKYIASLDHGTSVTLERYNGTGTQGTGQSYDQNAWKLVTAVFTPDTTELYINGNRVSTQTSTNLSSFLTDAKRFYVGGAENGWPNEYFTGYIDEFKVWDYAMTQEQAKELYDGYIVKNLDITEAVLQEQAEKIFHYKNNEVRGNITLPKTLSYGGVEDIIKVDWETSDASLVSTEAVEAGDDQIREIPAGKVNRPAHGSGDKTVTLTATLSCEAFDVSTTKTYDLTIKELPEEQEYKNYVYSYFQVNPYGTGESQNIHLAVSEDGLKWRELNDADPILKASDLRKPDGSKGEGGVRDSYLLRSADGDHFYLIGTDLDVFDGQGWGVYGGNGSRYIAVWESDDLVHWYNERLVPLANPDHSCMWAPEATWDPVSEQYLVYWSSGLKDGETGKHIYCAYTRDFYTFSEPEIYKGVLKPDTSSDENLIASRGYYFKKSTETNTDNGVAFGQPNWIFQKIYVSEPEEKILDVDGNDVNLNQMTIPSNWKQLAVMEENQRLANMSAYDAIPEQITYLDTSMLHYNGTYYRLTKRENDVTVLLEYSDDIKGPWTLADTIIADQYGVEGPAIYAITDAADRETIADALNLEETPEVVFQIYLDGYGNYHAGYYPLIATSEEDLKAGNLQVMPDNSYQLPIGAKHGSFVPITDGEYQALVAEYGVVDHKEKAGQVVYYDMETDEEGNLIDKSGADHKGTFGVKENAAAGSGASVVETEEEDGTQDRVLKFDGNGYVKLPTNLLVDENDLTISMWVKNTEETPGASSAFYFGMKNPYQYCMLKTKNQMTVNFTEDTWIYYDKDGKEVTDHQGKEEELFARNHYDGNHNQKTMTKAGTANDWALYTIMIDAESDEAGTGSVVKMYYDGELAGTLKTEQKPTDFGIALVSYLGKSAYNDPYFVGEMKEFKIYDRLWSGAELEEEYKKLDAYRTTHQEPVEPLKRQDEEHSAIASFSFDSYDTEEKAFVDEKTGAVAKAVGNIQISESEKVSGQGALALDGESYLNVTDVDGRSLLAGYEEVTISYLSKVTKDNYPNWGFIAQQTGSNVDARKYIGTIEFQDRVALERSNGTGGSPQLVKTNDNKEWHLVTAVLKEGTTELYIDKELVSRDAEAKLSEFFEGSSTFQIGKADWGAGEYFNGYIDEFAVYNYAFTADEVETRYKATLGAGAEVPQLPFEDVTDSDWYYNDVAEIFQRGLMTGINSNVFAPNEPLSRAQFAVILYRMEGKPEVTYESRFPDVDGDTWYTDAVAWAGEEGIITGYADKNFGPADSITREQMAVMMYRYANMKKYDTDEKEEFDRYQDASKVSGFAEEAMQWAVGSGIFKGKFEETVLDPQGDTSRGECAVILTRFLDKFEQ